MAKFNQTNPFTCTKRPPRRGLFGQPPARLLLCNIAGGGWMSPALHDLTPASSQEEVRDLPSSQASSPFGTREILPPYGRQDDKVGAPQPDERPRHTARPSHKAKLQHPQPAIRGRSFYWPFEPTPVFPYFPCVSPPDRHGSLVVFHAAANPTSPVAGWPCWPDRMARFLRQPQPSPSSRLLPRTSAGYVGE